MKPKVPVINWTDTIRLPAAKFLPRPDPRQREAFIKRCSDAFYKWQASPERIPARKETFVLHDGPPYANGNLHVGHALNKILKDVIIRHKVQQGHRVQYIPGWDCHGLPIELKALSSTTTDPSAASLPPGTIRQAARALATDAIQTQMAEFRSYAVMADWDRRWTTMDATYELNQLRLFQQMVRRGLIYRRFKPVYWSPSSRTALAEAELEYKEDHRSKAAYVKFEILPHGFGEILKEVGWEKRVSVVIWTTTPWTLPANAAIAVHKDLMYDVLLRGEEVLIVASECVEAVRKALAGPEGAFDVPLRKLAEIMGEKLVGRLYVNPLWRRGAEPAEIVHADFVTPDSGSGLVHIAPGHGFDDYELCKSLSFRVEAPPVDDAGHFTVEAYPDDPSKLEGLAVQKAGGPAVLKLLGDDVLAVHTYKHKYPYDWRTKEPIIIRATAQWFADVGSIKESAIAALHEVKFVPESGKRRLEAFVKGRSEWCISRQRAWGVPIPALYDKNGDAVVTDETVEHLISVIEERGTDAWWSDPADDPAWIPESLRERAAEYRRGTDTMDVWFDSGSSWKQMLGQADVYLEGSDQHRGWFQSSLLTRVAAMEAAKKQSDAPATESFQATAPFKTLITHGFTLDTKGKKMSKSLGNIISPQQVMDGTLLPPVKRPKTKSQVEQTTSKEAPAPNFEALGPDALRLWACSSDYTSDVVIGIPVLKTIHTALIKYRTTLRVLLGSLSPDTRNLPLTALDHIALVQLDDAMREVGEAYANYEFARAFRVLNNWVVNDLSAFYLEALKDRLYCGDGGGVLEPILMGMLQMLAPMTPVLVEEAWEAAPEWLKEDPEIIHPLKQLYTAPLIDPSRLDANPHLDPERLRRHTIPAIQAVHRALKAASERARRDKRIGSSLQCDVVLGLQDPDLYHLLKPFQNELAEIMVVSSVDIKSDNHPLDPEELQGKWSYSETFSHAVDGLEAGQNPHPGGEECTAWVVEPAMGRCARCWRYLAEKGEGESICGRCEDVVGARGERG